MTKPAYIFYYTICLLVLGCQAVATVYQSSLTVNHTAALSHLQQERKELAQKKTVLERQTASLLSLQQAQLAATTQDYHSLIAAAVIGADTTVALR